LLVTAAGGRGKEKNDDYQVEQWEKRAVEFAST
jgi:hypothetical protein